MAQTKSKSNARRSGSSSRGSRSSGSKSNGSSGSRAKGKSKASQKTPSTSNGITESIKHGAGEVAPLARKAKVPLLASGAALAGVAGAVVASRSGRRHKEVLGISIPKRVHRPKLNGMKPDPEKISGAVVDAAKRADRFAQGVSRVASSVRDVGETANKAAKKT